MSECAISLGASLVILESCCPVLNKLDGYCYSHELKYIFDEFYAVVCRTINPHHIIK